MDPHQRAAAFARISNELLAEREEQPTLQSIVDLAVQTVPGCELAGVSVRRGRSRVETPASTSPLVDRVDALQYDLDEGPCLEAIRAEATYIVDDSATDPRWPRWGPKVAALGLRSILTVRLSPHDVQDVLGGLNLYASGRHAFSEDDVDIAQVYAAHAAGALDAAQVVTGLRTAMHTRHTIGVAQGLLMQRYGLSLDRSFEVLVRFSREHNVKLRVVAEGVVESGGFPVDDNLVDDADVEADLEKAVT